MTTTALRATIDAHLAVVHRGLGLRVADPGEAGWSLIVALPGEEEGRRIWVTDEPAVVADALLSADDATREQAALDAAVSAARHIHLNGFDYYVLTDGASVSVHTEGRSWLGTTDSYGEAVGLRLPSDERAVCNVARTVLAKMRDSATDRNAADRDLHTALAYAERSIQEEGDPWTLAQGVPVGRGAAPLSGPCVEGVGL